MDSAMSYHQGFREYQAGRGFTAATIKRRSLTVRGFERFCAPLPLTDATTELVEEWLGRQRTAATRRAYQSDLRMFYRWAMRRRLCAANPVDSTDPVRVPKALPNPVDPTAVDALIAAAPDWDVALACALGAYAGLRCAEVCALTTADLSLTSAPAILIVRQGKGRKDRAVPVHPHLATILASRPAGRLVPIQPGSLGRKVGKYLRAQGHNATLHKLRHTFGTELARATNGNLLVVGALMGHESLSTTMGYVKLIGQDSAAHVAAMYPPAA